MGRRPRLPTGHPTDHHGRPVPKVKTRFDLLMEHHPKFQGHHAELLQLYNSRCAHCRHAWLAHFDTKLGVMRACTATVDGVPACNCTTYAPNNMEEAAAMALIEPQDPLVAEGARAASERRE